MKTLLTILIAVLFLAGSAPETPATNVAVVMSSDATAYQESLAGFREATRHRIASVLVLKPDPATWRDEMKKLRSSIEPDIVFVIGTSALQAVAGEITNIPIVHAMVFNPFPIGKSHSKNIIGIRTIPQLSEFISLLKELNPKYRRIGTLLDPARTGPLLQEARSAFEKAGLQFVQREIRSPSEVGSALKSLERQIDLFWLWPDETLLAEEIVQRIILFSFEWKIPVFGLSQRHSDMGAVLSLAYGSAKDMGRQAGEAANQILKVATPPASLAPPRNTRLMVNLKSAARLGLDVPESFIRRADNAIKAPIYKEGDWWVFRIRTLYADGKIDSEVHRVSYKRGQFESDDPTFLTGYDLAAGASFLPFASVYLADPNKKWLDFPLLPGRKWSFRYSRRYYLGRGSHTSANAAAEVVGPVSQPIQTPAGNFDAIEIYRVDSLSTPVHLTYFYSPETKSVVHLRTNVDTSNPKSSGRRFELDLIAFGNESTR